MKKEIQQTSLLDLYIPDTQNSKFIAYFRERFECENLLK